MILLKELYEKYESTIILIMIVLFSTLLLFMGIMLIVAAHRAKKQKHKVSMKQRKCYLFSIDFKKFDIIYFEKSNPREQVKLKLDVFYTHILDPRSRDLFRKWLENIFSENQNLLSEITINLDGKNIISLYFTIDSLDQERRIVHLSSYSVEYLNDVNRKRRYFLSSINENKGIAIDSIFNKKSVGNGLLLYIRFFAIDKRNDQTRQANVFNELRQVCFLFVKEKKSRFRIETEEANTFVIYDTGCSSLQEMQQATMFLIKKLNSRLELHSYQDSYSFSIGVVETKYFNDGRRLLDVALNKSISAEHQDSKFDWFVAGDKMEEFSSKLWEEELENTIKGKKRDRKLRFLYQPMVQSLPLKMYGYYVYIEPENSSFRNLSELRMKANEYGRGEELFYVTCRTIIGKFYNEIVKRIIESGQTNELKLFIPISKYEKDYVIKALSEIRHMKDCNIVLVIDENDVDDIVSSNYEEAIASLIELKKKKVQLALMLESANLTWANGVYEAFDYFMVDKSLTSGEESLDQSSVIKRLSAKLVGFHRPLIAIDMENKSMIHILRDRNFEIFAGNIIEAPNENIIELTIKKMNIIRK